MEKNWEFAYKTTITGGMRKEKAESRPRHNLYGCVYLCVFLRAKLFFFFISIHFSVINISLEMYELNGTGSQKGHRGRETMEIVGYYYLYDAMINSSLIFLSI